MILTEEGMNAAAAQSLLRAMAGRRIAVVGDLMLDQYCFGQAGRISAEAPVPIVALEREEHLLGGAANVAKCLAALGAEVRLCGVVGRDADGDLFLEEARGLGLQTAYILRLKDRRTTLKTRVIAQRQQMLRLDREETGPLPSAAARELAGRARAAARGAAALVLSDYRKGVLTPGLCRELLSGGRSRPAVVDPKRAPWNHYSGATLFKPNRRDARAVTGIAVTDAASAAAAAREIFSRVRTEHILLTRSEEGMTLASRLSGRLVCRHFPAWRHEVADSTGCGDVVSAVTALALAAGAPPAAAAWLANVAAGVKAGKFGAAAVSPTEILEALGAGAPACARKVLTRQAAAAWAAGLRRQGRKIVFTNGCFDILHYGHVSLLERARKLGDALLVGVNTDASVRRLKGPGRPVQPERDRARILAAQACVDAVTLFDEDTPRELIRAVLPDVLCKGRDYRRKENVVGWDLVSRRGGRVALLDLETGRSTSRLLERARPEDGP